MHYTTILLFLLSLMTCTPKQTSGYMVLERQYYSQQNPDSLTGSFTRKLFFNNNYSFLTIADSSATADDHFYIKDYLTNTVYLKKTFDSINYYAEFPINKNHNTLYTVNKKILHGYECKEGVHIGQMNDTTTFWTTDKIGLDRTIWSLVDVDGFVLETKYQNGIKKVIKNIQWKSIDDKFFESQIDTLKTYKKKSYYGLKIVEAEWELDYYKERLNAYKKMNEQGELNDEQYKNVERQFKTWLIDIKKRIKELELKDENH